MKYAVSNDVVSGGDASDLEAHPVSKEEGAVDATEGSATWGVFAPYLGPHLTSH